MKMALAAPKYSDGRPERLAAGRGQNPPAHESRGRHPTPNGQIVIGGVASNWSTLRWPFWQSRLLSRSQLRPKCGRSEMALNPKREEPSLDATVVAACPSGGFGLVRVGRPARSSALRRRGSF
ncbi:hypothetical protein HPB47_019696 [Ixodes persulcatus]|uniref:Uncharacterized protein n=1 Tax=Ixodes persulcatus TaxID=34615 RepID=A0AC60QHD1_IXOPE|nr:hypothetical protein HPB47_019696 [Ixodes persulcatus]